MRFTSTTAAVLLGCSAAAMAEVCKPVPRLNKDNTITVTGLGSRPDYTFRIESDGTPFSEAILGNYCSEVTTACSGLKGAELEDEIDYCITDAKEFIDYTMAEVEQMVAEAQGVTGPNIEQQPQQQPQAGVEGEEAEFDGEALEPIDT